MPVGSFNTRVGLARAASHRATPAWLGEETAMMSPRGDQATSNGFLGEAASPLHRRPTWATSSGPIPARGAVGDGELAGAPVGGAAVICAPATPRTTAEGTGLGEAEGAAPGPRNATNAPTAPSPSTTGARRIQARRILRRGARRV